jgi:outer membrane protein assembly factor BamE (lipoprotein component of BamABCDE complex)
VRHLELLSLTGVMFLCLTLWSGCSFGRGSVGDELKPDDVLAIKKGVTTRSKVVDLLGAPDRVVEANGRDIFQYYRYDLKAGSLILIIVNFSRFNIRSDDLYVFFNKDGVVDEVVFGKRTDKMEFRFWPFGD